MKVQLYIDPENKLSKVPYQVPNNIHYVRYQDYLDVQTQPDALTAYLYAAELAKDDIKKLKAEVQRLTAEVSYDKRCELHTDRLVAQFTQSEVESLKAENEELHKDYEALADEHTKLIDSNKTLKAEVERLKGGQS